MGSSWRSRISKLILGLKGSPFFPMRNIGTPLLAGVLKRSDYILLSFFL
jgi:hypothetical protein